jgi:hypothetical protein
MLNPKRPHHKKVLRLLNALSAELLEATACYFGGGTRIVLELDEYRESLDVDFLCANQDGYRELRNQVTSQSLGGIFADQPMLLRDVRADMYGIRTFVEIDSQPVKFEIIREARIPLAGTNIPDLPVPCLDHSTAIAEKFLANADRGLDKSTRSRDLIDLAFMVGSWDHSQISQGLELAKSAYGDSVLNLLDSALELFDDGDYRKQCLSDLEVRGKQTLETGLRTLASLAKST